jgi:hypothetical protein
MPIEPVRSFAPIRIKRIKPTPSSKPLRKTRRDILSSRHNLIREGFTDDNRIEAVDAADLVDVLNRLQRLDHHADEDISVRLPLITCVAVRFSQTPPHSVGETR